MKSNLSPDKKKALQAAVLSTIRDLCLFTARDKVMAAQTAYDALYAQCELHNMCFNRTLGDGAAILRRQAVGVLDSSAFAAFCNISRIED